MDKKSLRKEIKQSLALITEELRELKSIDLSQNLLALLPKIKSKHCLSDLKFGVFAPFQKEPFWQKEFTGQEGEFFLVHMYADNSLSFHPVGFETLIENRHGLELEKKYLSKEDLPNVILVPGLAFTKEGQRLGRGKGYYDRYLTSWSGVKIGICFEDQILEDVAFETHDVEMDYIVTETKVYIRGKI